MEKSKYKCLSEWKKADKLAYKAAIKLKIVDKICNIYGWENTYKSKPFIDKLWTLDMCLSSSLKYESKAEWRKNDVCAYNASYKYGWASKCSEHFFKKHSGYWTKERCIEEAKKYKSKNQWSKNSFASFNSAKKIGFLEDCCAHMEKIIIKKWTFDECIEEAKKYKSRKDWVENSNKSYNAAYRLNCLKECTEHMIKIKKHSGCWTKERCIEEAKKYKSKKDWKINSVSSYNAAYRLNCLKECTKHMIKIEEKISFVDCKKDADKYKSRKEWEQNSKRIYNFARKNKWISDLCCHMSIKPFGYWTKERCIEEAKKYKSKKDWKINSVSSYNAAWKKGWYKQCCVHMKVISPIPVTKETCLNQALNFKRKTDWAKSRNSSYGSALKKGWIKECCAHMVEPKKTNGYWTKEKCIEEALKYTTKSDWQKKSKISFKISKENNWIDECCNHIKKNKKWNFDECIEEAKKYKKINEWRIKSSFSYNFACKSGFLDECCTHMIQLKKPSGYWTKKLCTEEAKKYQTKKEWKFNSSSSYIFAYKSGFLDECCTHMVQLKKPSGYWTKERCIEEAKKYQTRKEWIQNSYGSYCAAYDNKWMSVVLISKE